MVQCSEELDGGQLMSPTPRNVYGRAALWAMIITLAASAGFYIPLEYAKHNHLDFFNIPTGYKLIAYPSGVVLAPGELIAAFALRIATWVWVHSLARGSSFPHVPLFDLVDVASHLGVLFCSVFRGMASRQARRTEDSGTRIVLVA
jgi:hypothetical protein